MKCRVTLYNSGRVFHEIVIARDYDDAKTIATARNPTSKIISVTAIYDWNNITTVDTAYPFYKSYDFQ